MAVEIELKLSVAPEHVNRLRGHPFFKNHSTARAATQKLYSVYYDTPQLALRDNAMALRLRRVGRQWLQTLKGGGGVQAGLHQRNEWEMPVAREALDLEALKAAGGKLPPGVGKKLQPVFITDFSRNVRQLAFEGAEIEFGLDSGEIRAGKKTRPISELELELKSGEPQQLFQLALALLDIVPLQIENTSKAEYGYRLFSGEEPEPRKASLPRLDEGQSIPSALQNITAACLLQVQANVAGALRSQDEEYLHLGRVALRRLQVVLAMAEDFRADAELHALRREIKELNAEFGHLREWDVFATQTLPAVGARFPKHAALRELVGASQTQRMRHRAALVQGLHASDYQRLLLRFGAWMYGDYWHDAVKSRRALPAFAASILDKRSRQMKKRARRLGAADAGQLHVLRISCKKLRYSAEMFASLYAQARTKPYIAALTRLQDALGTLHDMDIARRLLGELEDAVSREVLGLARDWLEDEHARQMARLKKAWKRFEEQDPFWN